MTRQSARAFAFAGAVLIHLIAGWVILRESQPAIGSASTANQAGVGRIIEVSLALTPMSESAPAPAPARLAEVTLPDIRAGEWSDANAISEDAGETTEPPSDAATAAVNTLAATVDATDFGRRLLEHIERHKRYPDADAQMPRGVVRVLFTMRRDGSVLGAWIQTSSGSRLLDTEAMTTLLRGQPLPAIPPELPERMSFYFDIEFRPPVVRLLG